MDDAAELEQYAEIDGSEWGETCMLLCQLYRYRTYASDRLVKALEKEIKDNLKYAKDHCTIIELEQQSTTKYKVLEWDE